MSSYGGCEQDKGAALCRSRADGMAGNDGRIEALRLWAGRRGEGGDLDCCDAGHFAIEAHAEEIGQLMLDFLARLNPCDGYAARRVGERLSLQRARVPNSG